METNKKKPVKCNKKKKQANKQEKKKKEKQNKKKKWGKGSFREWEKNLITLCFWFFSFCRFFKGENCEDEGGKTLFVFTLLSSIFFFVYSHFESGEKKEKRENNGKRRER